MKYIYIYIYLFICFIHNVYVTVRYSSVWCLLRSSAHTHTKLTHEYTHTYLYVQYIVHIELFTGDSGSILFNPCPFRLGPMRVRMTSSTIPAWNLGIRNCCIARAPLKVFTHTHTHIQGVGRKKVTHEPDPLAQLKLLESLSLCDTFLALRCIVFAEADEADDTQSSKRFSSPPASYGHCS